MTLEDIAAYRKMEAEQRTRDWPNICRYRAANADLLQQPASERRIVFMGDSITQNWGFADPAYFTSGIVNRGISGQTSPQMLARFRSDVIALRPAVVHLLGGVNDIAGNTGPTTVEDIEGNLASMVEIAQANGVRVVLATGLPAASFSWAPEIKPSRQILALNQWIRSYAANHDVVLADYYPALVSENGSMRSELSLDGVHPNKAGYAVMAPITRAAIARALAR
jgi:lysophospholipase L1-like esterase